MSPPQQSSPGQPAGSDATGPPGGNRCDRGDNPTGIDAAAASPGGDRVNRGDNPNRLQKTLSENSETNSESDHDDYHKMTAGGDADNNVILY